MSVMTIVDPTGVSMRIETMIPASAQTTEITAEQIVTERKLLKTLIDESAGKMTSADPFRGILQQILCGNFRRELC